MIPNPNSGLLFDREEYKQSPADGDYAGAFNLDGKVFAIVGRKVVGDFGDMISLSLVPWEVVKANPKIYGMTEKQAIKAEFKDAEF